VDQFKDAIEELCNETGIDRISLFFDEAAHILLPEQQRQFFTLFRDLRSPYVTCNAAVYPGVTAYGETFQPVHDATILDVERSILSSDYVPNMRELVLKQADDDLRAAIEKNGGNFSIIAYAAHGNPRLLLKTVSRAPKLNSREVNEIIKEYYRTEIWAEHSSLGERYSGHQPFVDWGRWFVESQVLPAIAQKNAEARTSEGGTSCYVWLHRDVPAQVKEAMRLLEYTSVISGKTDGIRAYKAEVGTRYAVNLGCLFALEAAPTATALEIVQNLAQNRMTVYGANHVDFQSLLDKMPKFEEATSTAVLHDRLTRPLQVLDLTSWQKEKLAGLGLTTVGDVLQATEEQLQEADYIGEKRARRIRNAAMGAVFEYLSG
jgi:hypothetical protein